MTDTRVADIILQQLGGNKFTVMTGSKNYVSDGNTLRMSLARNKTSANRLEITLNGIDLYKMRFFRFTMGRFNVKNGTITQDSFKDVKVYEDVYCDQLAILFKETTGMDTHL